MRFSIELRVDATQAQEAFDAILEALDRILGWPVCAIEIGRWADDGGREP